MYIERIKNNHCKFCPRDAEFKVIINRELQMVCKRHLKMIKSLNEDKGKKVFIKNGDQEIKLQNSLKKNGETLYKSRSYVAPKNAKFSWANFGKFGKKIPREKTEVRLLVEAVLKKVEISSYVSLDGQHFTQKNLGEVFYLFYESGKLCMATDKNYNPIAFFS